MNITIYILISRPSHNSTTTHTIGEVTSIVIVQKSIALAGSKQ